MPPGLADKHTTITKMVSKVFYRDQKNDPLVAEKAEGCYIYLEDGTKILDASGGAAVTSVGHSNQVVIDAIEEQLKKLQFAHTSRFTSEPAEKLAKIILDNPDYESTGLSKVVFYNSGSEANESAFKTTRQYFVEKGEPQRVNMISRDKSYHGNTFGAMSLSGSLRHKDYEALFDHTKFHKVSTPYPFHYMHKDETEEEYSARLVKELDDKFQELGPDTVMAFLAETMSGGSCACVMPPKGYFEGVKAVCEKYGALLITDEVMCGSGRLGTFFAWEQLTDAEHFNTVSPHISTFGKSIGSGYLPLSGFVVHEKIRKTIEDGSAAFMSRHTYQGHPMSCAAGYAVQKYVRDNNLLDNVTKMGPKFEKALQEAVGDSKIVADIRGRGMFWGIELMKDKAKSLPFDPELHFGDKLSDICLANGLLILPGHGTIDGVVGDHIMFAPHFILDDETMVAIVSLFKKSLAEAEEQYA